MKKSSNECRISDPALNPQAGHVIRKGRGVSCVKQRRLANKLETVGVPLKAHRLCAVAVLACLQAQRQPTGGSLDQFDRSVSRSLGVSAGGHRRYYRACPMRSQAARRIGSDRALRMSSRRATCRSHGPCSCGSLRVVEHLLQLMQLGGGGLQLGDSVGDEFAGLWKLIGVVELLVADPLESVELVVVLLDLVDREAAPATVARVSLAALAPAVRVVAVALLELGEVLRGERSALLGDLRDVGASVVDPGALGWSALGEEDDVGLGALGVRD